MIFSSVCTRFEKIAKDRSLWLEADFSDGCLSEQQLKKIILKFLRTNTTKLHIRGHRRKYAGHPKWKTPLINSGIIKEIGNKCVSLDEFQISEAFVDASKIKMADFSAIKTIKHFHIVDCEYFNLPSPMSHGSYFKRSHVSLPVLESLEISKCNWIDDYDIMVLSKLDSLKKLILKNDIRIGVAMAYLAVSFRFGFKSVEEIDLRGTSLKTHDVKSVVQCGRLKALYLGPIGKVKRVSDGSSYDLSLVMPDPRYREEQLQQVVVLNVGPNGPNWRQVDDDELEGMGLDWVRNAHRRFRERNAVEDEDVHYFVGRDGRPVDGDSEEAEREAKKDEGGALSLEDESCQKNLDGETSSGGKRKDREEDCDSQSSKKKRLEDDVENLESKPGPSKSLDKQSRTEKKCDDDQCDEIDKTHCDANNPNINHEVNNQVHNERDDELTDNMVEAFGNFTKHLQTLVLTGCAITDNGLKNILNRVPTLKYLDVRNTYVTHSGIIEAHLTRSDCIIKSNPPITSLGNNTR